VARNIHINLVGGKGLQKEGGIGVCGVAVLGNFYCGVVVIVNPAGCGVCVSKPTVFGEAIYYL